MKPIESLYHHLKSEHPTVDFELDSGWLDIHAGGHTAEVLWTARHGFGFCNPGGLYGEGVDEVLGHDEGATARRVESWLEGVQERV